MRRVSSRAARGQRLHQDHFWRRRLGEIGAERGVTAIGEQQRDQQLAQQRSGCSRLVGVSHQPASPPNCQREAAKAISEIGIGQEYRIGDLLRRDTIDVVCGQHPHERPPRAGRESGDEYVGEVRLVRYNVAG